VLKRFLWTCLLVALPARAFAHENVDAARQLYEEAEFARAGQQLDAAEASGSLTRDDLVQLLELRMYLHLAISGQASLRSDLIRIVTLDPAYRPGDEAPPEVAETLSAVQGELSGPLTLRASAALSGSSVRVEGTVDNDPLAVTREVRITARIGETEPTVGPSPLEIPARSGDVVAYWAEALGPGAAVLAGHGDANAPLLFPEGGEPLIVEGGDEVMGWIIVGVVAGVLLAGGAVTLGVVLSSESSGQSDRTQPGLPMIVVGP